MTRSAVAFVPIAAFLPISLFLSFSPPFPLPPQEQKCRPSELLTADSAPYSHCSLSQTETFIVCRSLKEATLLCYTAPELALFPAFRKSEEEVDMDKVTAAMVLTSLSTSPLVRSPPVKMGEGLNGSWKDGGFMPSSYSSSGYWSWSAPSDHSNPSTPSPPLSADSFKPFRAGSLSGPPDDALDEQDAGSLLFDEPIPRKRKNSMKVMFKCLWKNCGKVLSTAAGIQRHIRTVHLGRNCDSECSDGEEDFYYTEIKLNTDSVADGLSSLSPVSPSVLSPPPSFEHRKPDTSGSTAGSRNESSSSTPLSRSAPSTLYLVHADHAYQATAPVNIPCTSTACSTPSTHTAGFTPSTSCSISWQSPPVTFTGTPASPTHGRTQGFSEQRSQTITVLSSPPRAAGSLSRKSRGEGKKCRKVYGMENRDMWCTACRWKKACQSDLLYSTTPDGNSKYYSDVRLCFVLVLLLVDGHRRNINLTRLSGI
ncbi:hypothetical protein P4O66_003572 [Electrophorus voltai]|uniref:C2H2-type domain-containing protein n=1 Tax=Electrophorus voltai TaxID=2609070 RepID=A0AAD9E2K1_9TELE|nr:hypothetical protein P4O66_003572 [Electrophorus voltai]